MPDTVTPVLGLIKPEIGASTDTWGPKYHAAMDTVDGLFSDPAKKVLKVANGGTGGDTPAAARTALELGALATLSIVDAARLSASAVVTDKLADGAVTTAKLASKSITADKLADGVGFPSGTRLLFQQSTAPVGWTKDTTHNDKALRVVSGNVANGGSVAFSSVFVNQNISGGTDSQVVVGTVHGAALTEAQLPPHTHTISTGPGAGSGKLGYSGGGTGTITSSAAGSGQAHAHGFTANAHSHAISAAINMAVAFVDVIIAVKD